MITVLSYSLTLAFFTSGDFIYAFKMTKVLLICEDHLISQKHVSIINLKLFSAILKNPDQKYHRLSIEGTRAMLTSGLAC